MLTKEEKIYALNKNLPYFIGSEEVYKAGILPGLRMTEGVKYLADTAGAYWLVDAICSHQLYKNVCRSEFQSWKLTVDDSKALLSCTDGNYNPITEQKIEFTDFPLSEITIWLVQGILMLPTEY